jgi:membrane associated rhomboid family serine protease
MATIAEEIKSEFRNGSMLSRILLVNVFVFLAMNLIQLVLYLIGKQDFFYALVNMLALPENPSLLLFKPWTLLTHIFLHIDIGHIFFNLLTLYWFGNIFKEYLGDKKLLPVFIYGGLAGALLSVLSFFLLPNANGLIMGASAGILAIVVATATLLPDYTIPLILIGPVRLKYIALVLVGIDLISIPNGDHTAHIAHIGGALYGFLYIKQLQKGNDWSVGFNKVFDKIANSFKPKPKITVVHKGRPLNDEEYSNYKKSKQETIDHILDKISKSGYESLSKQEKEILFKMSKE